jgi:DNA invertase Pin-like site-specific DNA recombinase
MKLFVIYYRVSTKKQEVSGLGLEAQETIVARFLPEGAQVVCVFTEIETGKNSRRPQMKAALAACKEQGATLVVAKLDRLARNVEFTSALMNSGIEFIACDCPYANRLTIHILAAVAEDEALRISGRTKAALAELKDRGVKLGSARPGHWDGREHLRGWNGMSDAKKTLLQTQRLEDTFGRVLPLIRVLRDRNEPFGKIATTLNEQGFKTSRGSVWTATAVQRVLDRDLMLA